MNTACQRSPKFRELLLAAACLLFIASPFLARQDDPIKLETELVSLDVSVTDHAGQNISGLGKDDFEIYEDGVKQAITHFAASEGSLNLLLLFDVSVSMEEILPTVKQEAGRLADRLRPDDTLSVAAFAGDFYLQSDRVSSGRAKESIGRLQSEPHPAPSPPTLSHAGYSIGDQNTYLYEAFARVFKDFGNRKEKVAVIVFTDGVDTGAGRSMMNQRKRKKGAMEEALRLAQESWVSLYPVRFKTKQVIGDPPEPARRPRFGIGIEIGKPKSDPGDEFLAKAVRLTGGNIFDFTGQQDLAVALEKALAEMRSRYSLGYTPAATGERGGYHQIKVRMKRDGLVARAREGYWVPK